MTRSTREGCAAICAACLVAASFTAPASAETEVRPTVQFGALWSDNVNLAAEDRDGDRQSGFVLELSPRLLVEQESDRFRSRLDYTLRAFRYVENSNSQLFHRLDAASDVVLLSDWLFIEGAAQYGQSLIDPAADSAYANGLIAVGDIVNQSSLRVAPRLDHQFAWGSLLVQHAAARVTYDDGAVPDSRDSTSTFAVQLGDEESRLNAGVTYSAAATKFDDIDRRFDYDQLIGQVGWRIGRDLRILTEGGRESDLQASIGGGGLDSTLWRAGLEWKPDRSNELRALAGSRFFGTTYEFRWSRRTRSLESLVEYNEGPTTESREFAMRREYFSGGPIDQLPVAGGAFDIARPSTDVFVRKQLGVSVALVGRLTRIEVAGSDERREYVSLGTSDSIRLYSIGVNRRLGPEWSIQGRAATETQTFRDGSEFDELRLELGMSRRLGETLDMSLVISRVDRSGAGRARSFNTNWGDLRFTKSFGQGD